MCFVIAVVKNDKSGISSFARLCRLSCLVLSVSLVWTELAANQDCFQYSHRISRLDKIVSKFSVADSLDLLPIPFTPPTRTRQDKTVLSWPCRFCKVPVLFFSYIDDVTLIFDSHQVNHHLYADDKQAYVSTPVNNVSLARKILERYISDITSWCASGRL